MSIIGRFFFTVGVLMLASGPARALDGPKPGAVSASTLKLPDKPASVRGLTDAATVNLFSAQVGYSVPIDLPAGPAGFGPNLGLRYSGELGNGALGVGWSIGSVSVRRSLRLGVPSYTDGDELDLTGIDGAGRLVPAPDFGPARRLYYVEGQGRRIKVEQQGQRFEITDAQGTRYFLGVSDKSREFNPDDVTRVLAWHAELIVNISGQKIEFSYLRDGNQLYPQELRWGFDSVAGPAPGVRTPLGAPKYVAKLIYAPEKRFDEVVSFRSGYEIKTARRLQQVQLWSFGTLARAYHLRYADQPPTAGAPRPEQPFTLSRIAGIEVHGLNDQERLPPLSFQYLQPTAVDQTELSGLDGWALNERGVSVMDVDGDGMQDLLRLEAGNHQWKKNLGGYFGDARALTGAGDVDLESSRLMDLDGDSRPDLVRIVDDTWRWYRLVGETWASQGEWTGTTAVPLAAADTVLCDINGDGRTDVVRGSADAVFVSLGGASGLGAARQLPRIGALDASVEPGVRNVRFVDVNGDGLADVVWLTDEWMKVFLGRGDGTFVVWSRVFYPWGNSAFDVNDMQLVDLDRDGLVDLIHYTAANVIWYQGQANLRFSAFGRHVPRPEAAAFDAVVTTADVLGTGAQEIVWSSPRGMWALALVGAGTQGMLSQINNGMGKTTTFQYSTSALLAVADENQGQPWDRKLPVNVPVPSVLQVDPGAGAPLRTVVFGVRDGFWDGEERRFGGFLQGRQDTRGDSPLESLVEHTRFHPGFGDERVLRGKVWYHRRDNGRGEIIDLERHECRALPIDGLDDRLSRRAAVIETRKLVYEGGATPIEARSSFDHDGEGRIKEEHHQGRLDLPPDGAGPHDEKEVRRSFASDESTGVRDVVCTEEVFAGNGLGVIQGAALSQVRFSYGDSVGDAPPAAGASCGVGKGWRRKTEHFVRARWPGEADHWVLTADRRYDVLGNVVSSFEEGVRREIGYAPVAGSDVPAGFFAGSETVRPTASSALTWTLKWNPQLGVPTEMTDPNGVVSVAGYDALARETAFSVGGAQKFHRYVYEWEQLPPRTRTQIWDGNPLAVPGTVGPPGSGWRETVSFANGAGEDLYAATRLDGGTWIINEWKERNARGLVSLTAEPFYLTSATPFIGQRPTSADFHPQGLRHDAVGRLVEHTLPNLGKKSIAYAAFEETVTSTDLAPIRRVRDGLGRIVRTHRTVNNVLEEVDASYDAMDRLTLINLQHGQVQHQFEYDSVGRLVHAQDPDIGPRDLRYDDQDRLIRHRNGAGQILAFFYDDVSRVIARGSRADFNAPVAAYSPQAQDYIYHYDTSEAGQPDRGNLKSRLSFVNEPSPEAGQPAGKVVLGYDSFGRVTFQQRTVGGATGWETSAFSPSGLLTRQEAGDGFLLIPTYDPAGRVVQMGDIWRVGQNGLADSASALDATGRVLSETYGNDLRQTYDRDNVGLPTTIKLKRPATPADISLFGVRVSQRTAYGAPVQVDDLVPGGIDQSATYAYDSGARLTDATMGIADASRWRFRYQYDGLQNMTGRFQQGAKPEGIGILAGEYRYGENGKGPRQLTSVIREGSPGGVITFDYDGAGRQVKDGDRTLTYDGYDQLTKVRAGSNELATHGYGYDSLRTYSRSATATQLWFSADHTLSGQERWHYVSVGDRLVARLTYANTSGPAPAGRVMGMLRALQGPSVATVQTGVVVSILTSAMALLAWALVMRRRATRTVPALVAATAVLLAPLGCGTDFGSQRQSLDQANKRLYFHSAIAAGPVLITDGAQNVVEERRFEPFGQPIDALKSNGTIGAVDFAGTDARNALNKETNPATGFSYHGARWMAPQTARWTAPDPPLKAPNSDHIADPWDLNPYQYVRQNPGLYSDPDGEIFFVFVAVLVVYTLAVTHESTANAPRTPDERTIRSPTNLEVAIGVVQNAPDVARFTLPKWGISGAGGNRTGGGTPPPKSGVPQPGPSNIRPGAPPGTAPSKTAKPTTATKSPPPPPRLGSGNQAGVPAHARRVADHVRTNNGQAPPGFKGGKKFENDGRDQGQVLPKTDSAGKSITYKEYDVNPYQKGIDRGKERIVTGTDGNVYYTADHYKTFSPM